MNTLGSMVFDIGVYIGEALRDEEALLVQLFGDNIMDSIANISADFRDVLAETPPEMLISTIIYDMQTLKDMGADVNNKSSLERTAKKLINDEELEMIITVACVTGVALSVGNQRFARDYDNASYQGVIENPSTGLLRDRTATNLRLVIDWGGPPSSSLREDIVSILENYPLDWKEDALSNSSNSLMAMLRDSVRRSPDKEQIAAFTIASSTAAGSAARAYIRTVPFLYDLYVPDDHVQADRLILVWSVFILGQTHPAQLEAFGMLGSDSIFPKYPDFSITIATGVLKQIARDNEIGDGIDGTLWSRWTLFHWLTVYALQPDLVEVPTMPIGPGAQEALGTKYPNLNQLSELGRILDERCETLERGVKLAEHILQQSD